MRLSPTLFAVLTVSATWGIAPVAHGQSFPLSSGDRDPVSSMAGTFPRAATAAETLPTSTGAVQGAAPVASATMAQRLPDQEPETLTFPDDEPEPESPSTPEESEESVPDVELEEPDSPSDLDDIFSEPTREPAETPEEPSSPVPAEPQQPDAPDAEADEEDEQPADAPSEPRVLVAELRVESTRDPLTDELEQAIYNAISTQPGRTTTRTQLQQDINDIFATGFFANVQAEPEDTPLGVRVTFIVEPNPVLTDVRLVGNEVLPEDVIDEIFQDQYGDILNLIDFQDGILDLNQWYQDNGYVLAQVVSAPRVNPDGVVTLEVAEGVIEDIQVRFRNSEGQLRDEEGNPIEGRTHDYIILREMETEPGDVFRQDQIQDDLSNVFGLGIFDDVRLALNPGQDDPRKVTVIVDITERATGSVAAGAGFNFRGDIFGTVSYRQDNFGGNNQKFSAETQLSFDDLLFDLSFTDPWIAGDPHRTSYTVNGFARRSTSLVFDGGDNEIDLANGDEVRIRRLGSGISFSRPLGNGWRASLGTEYQRVSGRDEDGNRVTEDAAGNPLTISDSGADDLWTVQLGAVWDRRNNSQNPTQGSLLRLSGSQSIPIGSGSIFSTRLQGSYSYFLPVSFTNFTDGPEALAFNIQAGTFIGDVPPYDAFTLGGTNSVRGYDEGDVGSGNRFLQASIEYRFPLFSFIGGALFVDAGTDLGSSDNVEGDPAGDRGKPGNGFGYGAGVRVQTPIGPIRIDYGINDEGDTRIHFGIGERF